MRFMNSSTTVLPIAAALLLPVAANSAETDGEANTIVVTAQKRKQAAQDVPMSLTTLPAVAIERQGITSLQELGNGVAGVSIAAANAGAMRLTNSWCQRHVKQQPVGVGQRALR